MEQFAVADGFDGHDHRHGLKLLEETRETMTLANRVDDVIHAIQMLNELLLSFMAFGELNPRHRPLEWSAPGDVTKTFGELRNRLQGGPRSSDSNVAVTPQFPLHLANSRRAYSERCQILYV